ncbi:homeobox protein HOX1A-like isoform X2 [Phragmites australis]|uniref:homeobox protein HOX1A-like isoform X2 n=1 Tax=Phragmites australis TaxID=29695 RepID=UPI002D76A0DC|nr:homeobox protein HOX1A-like isoform X2 [Phragmites australis]
MLVKAGKIKACSLDKIRPEKELERAKAEILRCKLRIREVFQNLDYLLSKGKIDESLFDSEGGISCEDIFCASCGSKDVTLGNDIILCDGACDRGFHQNCLNPPLLTEDIPMGDEGWLCPACDCKIDCIDVINELQGSDLSIGDSWEKVFPEAAASTNGSKQDDAFDLPSDDSEDNDFDPNVAEEHVASKEEESSEEDEDGGSDSDDSNFLTSSDDSEPLMDKKVDDLGLPSEDSEDDDYDPAGPDSDKDIQKKQSSLDESDFTSDSDDFCAEIAKSGAHDEISKPSSPDAKAGGSTFDMEGITAQANTTNSNLSSMETEMDQNVVLPVSRRRQAERLDYKKLYDQAYGKASSDSSDDEEWSGKSTPEKGNEEQSEADSSAGKVSRSISIVHHCDEFTPLSSQKSLHHDSLHGSVDQKHGDLTSNGSDSTARKGQFGPIINQRLHEHFKTEQYPSRTVKESLAEELGLTFRQVSKWFESRRHFTKTASAKKGIHLDYHSTEKTNSPVIASTPVKESEGTMMEKPNGCRNDVANEEITSGNLDEGCKIESALGKDINCGRRMTVTPPESKQGYATILRKVGSPKGGSGKNHHKNASVSDVRGSQGDSAEDHFRGLDLVAEARKKAIQREMKKKKMGR